MAGFGQEMQTFNPSLQFQDLDMQMEVINQFAEQNPSFLESLNFGGFSIETCSSSLAHHQQQQPLFQTSYYAHSHSNLPCTSHPNGSKPMPVQAIASAEDDFHQRKRRKVIEQPKSRFSSISPTASAAGSGGNCSDNSKKKSLGKEKRVVRREKEHEEFEEFIHVRARRGQATDSHSLAERVRRAKINNKLKCLQNIVPGCHKTMGMAGTLDEIINYVHSLQNQVEFLSMELAAASSCYGLNSITEDAPKAQVMQECDLMQECKVSAIDRSLAQRGTNSHEEQEMDQLFRDRFGEKTCYGSTWTL